jgi:hypothetical protein
MEKKPMQIDQVLKAYAAVNVRSITLERQLLADSSDCSGARSGPSFQTG